VSAELHGAIVLGHESLLAEMVESGQYSEEQIAAVEALGPGVICSALREAADDPFWAAYDSVRSDAVRDLLRRTHLHDLGVN
jgi:hypothetical protein